MAKQYNPWTGFLEDTATKASVNDAAPAVGKKYTINGKEFKVLEVNGDNVKVLGSDGIVSHLNIKMFDEKPTIDKAIHSMDSAKSDASEVYNILVQAIQNSTNPNKMVELISKAQGKLLEMAARAKDSKCKTAVDKAIRNCDSNVKLVKTVAKKNGYAIHIVSGEYGERIVLTFPGENYNNPHMWLGSNTSSNMSKAQELLAVFGK